MNRVVEVVRYVLEVVEVCMPRVRKTRRDSSAPPMFSDMAKIWRNIRISVTEEVYLPV